MHLSIEVLSRYILLLGPLCTVINSFCILMRQNKTKKRIEWIAINKNVKNDYFIGSHNKLVFCGCFVVWVLKYNTVTDAIYQPIFSFVVALFLFMSSFFLHSRVVATDKYIYVYRSGFFRPFERLIVKKDIRKIGLSVLVQSIFEPMYTVYIYPRNGKRIAFGALMNMKEFMNYLEANYECFMKE